MSKKKAENNVSEQTPEMKEPQENVDTSTEKEETEQPKAAVVTGEQLEAAEAKRDEYLNALIRERADFENYKKRNATAVAHAYANGAADAVEQFLPVLDNLERAIAAATEEDPLKKGVELVLRQMLDTLKTMNVAEIEAEGKAFDPNLHNAVMQAAAEEGEEEGMVKEVLQKGYKIGDRVLRHSMVKVTG